jgi:hypothetical protein
MMHDDRLYFVQQTNFLAARLVVLGRKSRWGIICNLTTY